MPIRVFPPHYQLVYINFDISSFSLISYAPQRKKSRVTFPKNTNRNRNFCGSGIVGDRLRFETDGWAYYSYFRV